MKILFISRYYFPVVGGIEQNIFKISAFLKDKHSITVLTVSRRGSPSSEIMEGVHILRTPISSFLKFDLNRYDVVFLENFNILPHLFVITNIVLDDLLNNKNYRLFFVPHGGFTPYYKMFSLLSRMVKKIIHKTIGLLFLNSYCEKIIAVSSWERTELIKAKITRPIALIGNGFEGVETNYKKDDYFIFVGRIDPIKNIEGVVDVFSLIKKNAIFKSTKLIVLGNTSLNKKYFCKISKQIDRLGLADFIEFRGEITGKEKLQIVGKAKCLFCLSHFETDPIVVKEAFSQKTKVILSGKYGLSDYVGRSNVFIVGDINKIEKDDLFRFIGIPFEEVVLQNFTWGDIANQYNTLIDMK